MGIVVHVLLDYESSGNQLVISHESAAFRSIVTETLIVLYDSHHSFLEASRASRIIIQHRMIKDITEKLRKHLAGGVRTECRVVYLLAEIRKILEEEKPDPRPMALWMFCHWALHVNLSRSGTTAHFLEQIDAFTISKNIKDL